MDKHSAICLLALAASACGVADTDKSFWQQTKDPGGTQFQIPANGQQMEAAGGQPAEAAGGGAGTSNPNPPPGGTSNPLPGAGGESNPFPPGAGGAPLFGAGGAGGGFVVMGAGGMTILPQGAGGMMVVGAGGAMMGSGGATGNSGKCTFTFDVTTVTARGTYAPRNVGAIWISDAQNKFTKTLSIWGTIRLSNATAWTATGSNRVDAVTAATRGGHGAMTAKWDCTDVNHNAVMDGSYIAHVTFAESDANIFFGGTAIQASVNFTKAAAGADVMGTSTANFTNMHVKLTVP